MKPRTYFHVNPSDPKAAGRCDRGGEIRQRDELFPQMEWRGNRLSDTGLRVCAHHMDEPQQQSRPKPVKPDPRPVHDPRPDKRLVPIPGFVTAGGDRCVTEQYVTDSENRPLPDNSFYSVWAERMPGPIPPRFVITDSVRYPVLDSDGKAVTNRATPQLDPDLRPYFRE